MENEIIDYGLSLDDETIDCASGPSISVTISFDVNLSAGFVILEWTQT